MLRSSPFVDTWRTQTNSFSKPLITGSLSTKSSSNLTHSSQGTQRSTTINGFPLALAWVNPAGKSLYSQRPSDSTRSRSSCNFSARDNFSWAVNTEASNRQHPKMLRRVMLNNIALFLGESWEDTRTFVHLTFLFVESCYSFAASTIIVPCITIQWPGKVQM